MLHDASWNFVHHLELYYELSGLEVKEALAALQQIPSYEGDLVMTACRAEVRFESSRKKSQMDALSMLRLLESKKSVSSRRTGRSSRKDSNRDAKVIARPYSVFIRGRS